MCPHYVEYWDVIAMSDDEVCLEDGEAGVQIEVGRNAIVKCEFEVAFRFKVTELVQSKTFGEVLVLHKFLCHCILSQ